MPDSKITAKRIWEPALSTVEHARNQLEVAHEQPGLMYRAHWHAQVEVNFVTRGHVRYDMHHGSAVLNAGDLSLFWGGASPSGRGHLR